MEKQAIDAPAWLGEVVERGSDDCYGVFSIEAVGNNKVTDALDKIFATVDKGATDLQFFFGIAGRPIKGVADSVSDAVAEVQGIVDGSSWVRDDMDAIVARFQTVRNENEGRKEGGLVRSR